MTQPLALVVYEKLLPGTQLVNRLQDLNYRVRAVTDSNTLVTCAQQEKPMLVVADLESSRSDVCRVIAELKQDAATQHIPVIAIAREGDAVDHDGRGIGAPDPGVPQVASRLERFDVETVITTGHADSPCVLEPDRTTVLGGHV